MWLWKGGNLIIKSRQHLTDVRRKARKGRGKNEHSPFPTRPDDDLVLGCALCMWHLFTEMNFTPQSIPSSSFPVQLSIVRNDREYQGFYNPTQLREMPVKNKQMTKQDGWWIAVRLLSGCIQCYYRQSGRQAGNWTRHLSRFLWKITAKSERENKGYVPMSTQVLLCRTRVLSVFVSEISEFVSVCCWNWN